MTSTTNRIKQWLPEIPIVLVGTISTYLDINDVRNLIRTTDTEQATVIKNVYMKHNFNFSDKSNTYITEWMRVNNDWKEMYDKPFDHGVVRPTEYLNFIFFVDDTKSHVLRERYEILKYVIDERDGGIESQEGCELVMFACQFASLSMVQYLLSLENIDINESISEETNDSPHFRLLHLIMMSTNDDDEVCSLDVLRVLLQHSGTDVNVCTKDRSTPLHVLCLKDITDLTISRAKLLLEAGADVTHRNADDMTPIDFFVVDDEEFHDLNEKQKEMVTLLRSYLP